MSESPIPSAADLLRIPTAAQPTPAQGLVLDLFGKIPDGVGGSVPTGSVIMWITLVAPSGWVLCDGTSYLRSAYHDLYATIGSGYGSVDSTHFNVPDIRGRVPVCIGTNASVNVLNLADSQAVADRRPYHRTTKNLTLPDHQHGINFAYASGASQTGPDAANSADFLTATGGVTSSPAIDGSVGSNVSTDNVDAPSFVVLNFIIKT